MLIKIYPYIYIYTLVYVRIRIFILRIYAYEPQNPQRKYFEAQKYRNAEKLHKKRRI